MASHPPPSSAHLHLQKSKRRGLQWSLPSLASSNGQTKLLGLTSLVGTAAVAGGGFLGRPGSVHKFVVPLQSHFLSPDKERAEHLTSSNAYICTMSKTKA